MATAADELSPFHEKLIKEGIEKIGPLELVNAEGLIPFDSYQKVRFLI